MWKSFLSAGIVAASAVYSQAQTPTPPIKAMSDDSGRPVGNNQNSRTSGEQGPVTLDNLHLIQKLARFDRERIPERVVHARGIGAHGDFVSYGDQSKFTKAKVFSSKDKVTPVFMRLSTVIHPSGSPEQLRDPRGFAVKFYTEEGNWDLVGNNMPVFFIRDAIKFPDMVHSLKPSPVTNQQDPNRFFDFFSHQPESTHMLTFLYSDQGTPANLRQMDGFGVNAYKFVNAAGKVTYVKFNWRSLQGLKPATAEEAAASSAKNHSALSDDLYTNIKAGNFPAWELGVQLMSPADLDKFDFNPLDDTKIWPGIEEVKIGKLTLNKVPANFFQFTQQVAYSPAVMPPGIEASEDRMLQGRLFSYGDTQRYRIGANYLDLPVNRPLAPVSNNNQDGAMNANIAQGDVNYEPSVTTNGRRDNPAFEESKLETAGPIMQQPIAKTLNFQQAGELYRGFTEGEKTNLIKNLSGDLGKVTNQAVKVQMISHFHQADADYGTRLAKALNVSLDEVKSRVAQTAAAGK